jgi:NADH dehydrogenase/NADH:ubiquinone oxidoreductase subunit G
MSKMVKLTMDDVEFQAPEGINLIDAAELAGIHIPNLCYLKGMKGIGACRLCIVEVEGAKGHVIACNTKVKEGMVVRTKTDEILEARKFVVDLILSMHPLDCMTCTKAGVCNLQRYAYEFELKESSFSRKKFGYPVDIGNPFIKMSPDYCILCGKCVRVCKEQGTNVLEFMGRGVGAKVTTVVDRALQESNCTFCGSCIDACPVNAIIESDRWRRGREWDYEKLKSVCLLCGNACDIEVSVKDGRIQKANAGAEIGSAMKYICAYGRFGFDYLETDNRVSAPMVRKKNAMVETTWPNALKVVAEKLKGAGKNVGFVSTASLQNEDLLALKEFASKSVKSKNYDSTMSLYADTDSLVNSDSASINDADLIILVGINPSQRLRILPMLNVSIRRRVARGAKLIIINGNETKLDKIADVKISGDEIAGLKALIKSAMKKGVKADKKLADEVKGGKVDEDAEKAGEIFAEAKNPIVYTAPSLFDPASNLSLMKGNTIAVTYESNAKGAALMGLAGKGKSYRDMVVKGAKVLYIVGSPPLHERPDCDFLIVQDSHFSEIAKHADIFLPTTTFLESAGTVVDFKGRLKFIPKMIESIGKSRTHREILMRLSKLMDSPIKKPTEADVRKKVKKSPKHELRPFKKKEGMDVLPEMVIDSINSAVIAAPRLFWLKETEKVTAG